MVFHVFNITQFEIFQFWAILHTSIVQRIVSLDFHYSIEIDRQIEWELEKPITYMPRLLCMRVSWKSWSGGRISISLSGGNTEDISPTSFIISTSLASNYSRICRCCKIPFYFLCFCHDTNWNRKTIVSRCLITDAKESIAKLIFLQSCFLQ